MKSLLITILLTLFTLNAFAQTTEFSVQLNTGGFRFTGLSADKTEHINANYDTQKGYTNNPYGNQFDLSYGLSASVTKIIKSNFRLGIDIGFEVLRSKIEIDGVWQHNDLINETVPASGKTNLNLSFINVFPKIGFQTAMQKYIVYLDAGVDIGYCLSAKEIGSAKTDSRSFETNLDRKTIDYDIRPRIQLGVSRNKYGAYVGYSKGITNYMSDYVGGRFETFSEIIRLGIVYTL